MWRGLPWTPDGATVERREGPRATPALAVLLPLVTTTLLLAACTAAGSARVTRTPPDAGAAPQPPAPLAPHASPRTTVRVAYGGPSESFAPLWIAKDMGIFDEHGLEVTLDRAAGPQRAVQALVAGELDFALASAPSLVRAHVEGADVRILSAFADTVRYGILTAPGHDKQGLGDLRGRRIGVPGLGSDADRYLRVALRRHASLDPQRDVTVVPLGSPARVIESLSSGAIEAGVLSGLWRYQAQKMGASEIADAKSVPFLSPSGTMAAKASYLAAHEAVAHRFVRAYVTGFQRFKTDGSLAVAVMGRYLENVDADVLEPLYAAMRADLGRLPYPGTAALQAVIERVASEDARASEITVANLVDLRFLDAVARARR